MIDDEQVFCENVCEYLTLRGFEKCEYALNVEEAIKLLQYDAYDLITLDVDLGSDSGVEKISSITKIYSGPIIFLSCVSDLETKLTALRNGGTDYLIKPIELEELYLRSTIMIDNFRKKKEKQYGDYSINVQPKSVEINGRNLKLTAIGIKLLLFFLKNPNVIHTREYIYDQVWGGEYFYSSRVVDTAVAHVRRETLDGNIKTVRGKGYMYVANDKMEIKKE